MTISKKIQEMIERASWIRKMFEEGARLKAEHGAGNVFDFSLGNPNVPPPDGFKEALIETVNSLEDGVVKVRLQGACAGCPMSQMTLKNGIERILKENLPEITSVENVQ